MDRIKKLQEVLKDEAFAAKLLDLEEPEDVQKELEEKGIDFSLAEIEQIGEMLRKVSEGEISEDEIGKAANGELSEEELEQAAGGFADLLFFAGVMGCMALLACKPRRW